MNVILAKNFQLTDLGYIGVVSDLTVHNLRETIGIFEFWKVENGTGVEFTPFKVDSHLYRSTFKIEIQTPFELIMGVVDNGGSVEITIRDEIDRLFTDIGVTRADIKKEN